jgi:hypothetical protein
MRTNTVMTTSKLAKSGLLALVLLVAWSCEKATDRTDAGGVLLTVTDFDGLPAEVSVNAPAGATCSVSSPGGCVVSVESVTLRNTPKDPTGVTSALMDVSITSYQVSFSRRGPGTRLPPTLINGMFGIAPVGGTEEFNNLRVLGPEQMLNRPLADLLFLNGGIDDETGSNVISLNVTWQFFGETLSGDDVASQPVTFTIDFVP